jgi:protein-L-isoaspartate(D-aspartate) O-methyltransferase
VEGLVTVHIEQGHPTSEAAHTGSTGDLAAQRRFFADEVQAICNLRTASLVESFASIPREQFLRPGPWVVRGEGDLGGPPRVTPDADPRRVYHNLSIAIDHDRQLFNGAPGLVAICIDALALCPGDRVLHVGCGLGYYSAIMAHCVGSQGSVVAIEVDEELAAEARANLAPFPGVDVLHGSGIEAPGDPYDAILVHAGMTHPHEAWLAALKLGGRLILPLTFVTEQMGTIGKGVITLLTSNAGGQSFDARVLTMTAIYSAVGLRNAGLNERLRDTFMRGWWPTFNKMRLDHHELSTSCWLHTDTFCFTA